MKKINYFFVDIPEYKKNLPQKAWILNCIEKENCEIIKIDFMFCSDSYLKNLNNKYLNHDTLTDVITLDHSIQNHLLGDVFISLDRVKENAKIYKTTLEKEIARIMIHGVLHLIGYKDKSLDEKKIMVNMENKYLKEKNI